MKDILYSVIKNKEWVFSGIGVFVLGLFFVKSKFSIKQTQKGGHRSVNTQIGKIK